MVSIVFLVRSLLALIAAGWNDATFRGLAVLLGGWLLMGTVVYSVWEGWNLVESLYFCVMTVTTIGYGDYAPTSNWMRAYTIVYALMGIGVFVAFSARLVDLAIRRRHG